MLTFSEHRNPYLLIDFEICYLTQNVNMVIGGVAIIVGIVLVAGIGYMLYEMDAYSLVRDDNGLETVKLDLIFERFTEPTQKEYEGMVVGLDRQGNSTRLSFADGAIIDSNGNMISDPEKTIRVGANLFIIYNQASPICKATIEYENGTKIVGFEGELNPNKYSIIGNNVTDICASNQVIKQISNLQILD